jgi:hypothetical protein
MRETECQVAGKQETFCINWRTQNFPFFQSGKPGNPYITKHRKTSTAIKNAARNLSRGV